MLKNIICTFTTFYKIAKETRFLCETRAVWIGHEVYLCERLPVSIVSQGTGAADGISIPPD